MAEEYTCIQCERLYDNTDGDTDERMCYRCLKDDTRPIRNIVRYNFAAYKEVKEPKYGINSVKLKQQKEKDDKSKS